MDGAEPLQPAPLSVTVIVPVYNGLEDLRGCLSALAAQDYPRELVEVLVVDNNSDSDVRPFLPEGFSGRLLQESRQSSYAARNRGLTEATGDVVAFTDADCRPHPDWLRRAVAALAGPPRADMVGGAIEVKFGGGSPRTGAALYEARHAFQQDVFVHDESFAATANMVTWRATFDAVGPFNGDLQSGGDMEWGKRAAAAGKVQRFAPDARVDHPARTTLAGVRAKALRVARGHRDLAQLQPRSRQVLLRAAAAQVWRLLRITWRWRQGGDGTPRALELRYLGVVWLARGCTSAVLLRGSLQRPGPGGPDRDH